MKFECFDRILDELNLKSLTLVLPRSRCRFAPEGAVGKISGKEGLHFEGKAIVFEGEEKALKAILNGTVKAGHVTRQKTINPETVASLLPPMD